MVVVVVIIKGVVVSLTQLCGVAATKLQGKYRGYKAKGELKKRKENGERCHPRRSQVGMWGQEVRF